MLGSGAFVVTVPEAVTLDYGRGGVTISYTPQFDAPNVSQTDETYPGFLFDILEDPWLGTEQELLPEFCKYWSDAEEWEPEIISRKQGEEF